MDDFEAKPDLGGEQRLRGLHEDKDLVIKLIAGLNILCFSRSF